MSGEEHGDLGRGLAGEVWLGRLDAEGVGAGRGLGGWDQRELGDGESREKLRAKQGGLSALWVLGECTGRGGGAWMLGGGGRGLGAA